jgi:AmiR/NasT family two-component response regulator
MPSRAPDSWGLFCWSEKEAKVKVLIAEDETIIRLDLRGLLEKHGMVVCGEARDGAEAVALARELEPDVALLDLRMPVLDGVEAARRIRAERPIPIVMLTAYSDRAVVEKAIEAGVFAYLVKPFRETDVVPAIRAAVARHTELIEARRALGARPPKPVELELPSASGNVWPVRLRRGEDGSLQIEAGGSR